MKNFKTRPLKAGFFDDNAGMMQILKKPFYLMRHGESEDNARGVISGGGSDPFLTRKGIKQAEIAALGFRQLSPKPTRIISSGLFRAQQTAKIMLEDSHFDHENGLNERHLGDLDGKLEEKLQKSMLPLPNEESSLAHSARVVEVVNKHLSNEGICLFVCHGGTIRRIFEAIRLQDKVNIGNAEIYFVSPHQDEWHTIRK